MRIELIRHGLTVLQEEHKYQGISDVPLSNAGKHNLKPSERPVSVVHVTPLRRTGETATILFPEAKQISVKDFTEMNFGDFEGRSAAELSADPLLSKAYQDWVDSFCEGPCPHGESKAQFQERVCNAFELLLYDICGAGETELTIVAHGGTIMALLERYAEPHRSYFDWHTESGHGFVLDTAPWDAHHKLTLLSESDYTNPLT